MAQERSTMSGRSDNTETDADAKLEIAKLQRQLRILKRDQQAYEIQAQEQIRKQEQEIEKLVKEQEELHQNLAAHKSLSRQRQDSEDTQGLQALLEQNDALDRELENEKQLQKQLQTEILSVESRLAEMRKEGVSRGHSQSSDTRKTKKVTRTLEGNLNRASTHYSDLMTKNTRLKEELDTLYLERDRFQKLRNNLTKELQKIRKSIGEMTKLSTAAYDDREEALSKMRMLKEKKMKDFVQYNTEIKKLERVIAHEFNLKNFMSIKSSEQTGLFDDKMAPEQMSDVKEPQKVNSGEESLDNLKEVFEKLQTVMEEDNLDLLVNSFIQAEDRNLAFLKFVNEQNSEAEKLKDQISKIKEEMEKFQREALQQEQNHNSLLQDIKGKLKKTESQAETNENRAAVLSRILDEIKTGVNSIFSEIGCDRSAVEDRLGFSSGITENNIMTYLDLVEEKTNELLSVQDFLNKFKDLEEDFSPTDLAKGPPCQNPELLKRELSIQPAASSLERDAEESPVTDEDERPLSQEELCRKIMKRRAGSSAPTRSKTTLKDQLRA
ncbi:coiled-coil domain-containing protein 114 isoform X1 [Girardinichthys multiradiatus]|uniref:coiled-coil domain-containing protein 114 isoform X1 n=1 Tax=Girardinichthys multiradiatus TaxID=208333 RepID=UPI001FABC0BA|nr:coiled-coil domain-containing protein 114 isoform X1 [Girardinichthys multiradiatus]